jgi:hypothetical protein
MLENIGKSMNYSHQNQNSGSPSFLPVVFGQALLHVNQSSGFYDAVSFAAEQAGCEFLFEVPGVLFDQDHGRAAVMRSLAQPQYPDQNRIIYVIFDGEDGIIRILEEFEVTGSTQDLVYSYSKVLEQLTDLPATAPH